MLANVWEIEIKTTRLWWTFYLASLELVYEGQVGRSKEEVRLEWEGEERQGEEKAQR